MGPVWFRLFVLLNFVIFNFVAARLRLGVGYGSGVASPTVQKRLQDLSLGMGATVAGAGTCGCSWYDVQNVASAPYDWSTCDKSLFSTTSRNITCLSYSGTTPDWALAPDIIKKYGPGIGYRFPPDDKYTQQFIDFHEAMSARYASYSKLILWSYGNEPNGCGWINDGCSNGNEYASYFHWLQLWYTAVKKNCPNCVATIGGIDYCCFPQNNASQWLEGIYQLGGKSYTDAISIHPYDDNEINWQGLTDTLSMMKKYDDSTKEVWISEFGWNLTNAKQKSIKLQNVITKLRSEEFKQVTIAAYLQIQNIPNYYCGLVDVNSSRPVPQDGWYTFNELAF